MKKILLIAIAVSLVAAGVAMAGISNTPHDFVTNGKSATYLCVACHTPHGALSSDNGPLWNRSVASTPTYTLYNGATMDMTTTSVGPQSVACLTCHNGVASTLVNYPGSGSTAPGPPDPYSVTNADLDAYSNIGSDLTNDHPVGFTYDNTADLDGNSFPALSGNQVGSTGMYVFDNTAGNDQFECATCHDVHNTAVPTQSPVYFLRTSNVGSAMCTACHVGKV